MKGQTLIRRIELAILALLLAALLLVPVLMPKDIRFFPARSEDGPSLTALSEGFLIIDDGCLKLWYFGRNSLLIWPYGYSYRTSWPFVEVLDRSGEVFARTGQYIKVGGGEVSEGGCFGPCWLVGEVVRD